MAYDFGGGGGGGGAVIPGAPPRGYNPASGGVPGVTDPSVALQRLLGTIAGNSGNIAGVESSLTGAASGALRNQYPTGYFDALKTLTDTAGRRASGDISDLLPELHQRGAEYGVMSGAPGSGASNTRLLRDIGLTRYGVENKALENLNAIKTATPTVAPFDLSHIIPSIADQQNAQERADIYRSAPVPESAYQRARSAAGGGGGGGSGWQGGGPARVRSAASSNLASVDDILKRYGQRGNGVTVGYGERPDAVNSGYTPGYGGPLPGSRLDNTSAEFDPNYDTNPLAPGGGMFLYGSTPPDLTNEWGDTNPTPNSGEFDPNWDFLSE
jgi:hypothetical protein